jgi:3-oxoacyl-[acyl-carrier-protein] synthase III
MSVGKQLYRGIAGTGSAVPDFALSNSQIATFVDTSDEWITERTGIRSRHIAAPHEDVLSLSIAASRQALEMAGITAQDLELIVVGTETARQMLPACAALLQAELQAEDCLAFDLRAACSGFLFSFVTADALQRSQGLGPALVLGAETVSRFLDWNDRNSCILFGDGAGAAVLIPASTDESPALLASDLHTVGRLSHLIRREASATPKATLPDRIAPSYQETGDPYLRMEGREVFKFAVPSMIASIQKVLTIAKKSIQDVSLLIPHQANARILELVCQKIGITDPQKIVLNIEQTGNTSAASIPIALDEAYRGGRIKRGDLVLFTAAGAGMTYGSVLLEW